jgi:hypothetical protein
MVAVEVVDPSLASVDCTMTLSNGAHAAHYRFPALPPVAADAGPSGANASYHPCVVVDGPQPTSCGRQPYGDYLDLDADGADAQRFIDALHIPYDGRSAPLKIHVDCGGTFVDDESGSACITPL